MSIRFEREVSSSYGEFVNSNTINLMEKYSHLSVTELTRNKKIAEKEGFSKYMSKYKIVLIIIFAFVTLNIWLGFCMSAWMILTYILGYLSYVSSDKTNSNDFEKVLKNLHNYQDYLRTTYRYEHTTECPICNKGIDFPQYKSLPFQGRCPYCGYIFTVIYREVKEKYFTYGPRGGRKINRIFYDGIKAIEPKTQTVEYIDDSVKIDIKDSVLIRSTVIGKKIGNVSNEDEY